jgi:CHASE2 domain-containing sensor protein
LIWLFGGFKSVDLRAHDLRYRLRGPAPASNRIAMVEVDDLTLHEFDDVWPLPRRYYAIAIDALTSAGAQAIAFDLLFFGETRDPQTHDLSVDDQILAAVTAEHPNLVTAILFNPNDASLGGAIGMPADSTTLIRHGRPVSQQRLAVANAVSVPYPDLLASAKEIGHTAVVVDEDGVVRRIPQFVRFGEWAYGSLVMRLVEVAARTDTTLPQFELAPEGIRIFWHGRQMPVPSDRDGATSIAFAGDQSAFKNRYSLLQVLQWYDKSTCDSCSAETRAAADSALAKAFRGKLILVGQTAIGSNAADIGSTPYSNASPLVYIHANAVNAALQGRFIWWLPAPWIVIALVLLGLGIGLVSSRLSLANSALAVLGTLIVIAGIDQAAFVLKLLDLPPTALLIVPPLTLVVVEVQWRRMTEHGARMRAKELDVARTIQQNLLPSSPPAVAGLDVSGRNIPADEIGGDYFDWLELEDGQLAVVVGDISGHGIPAALLMAFLRASFHATAQADRAPEDIVSSMNKSLARAATPGKFATFFLGVISVKDRRIRYCNGGHNSPYLLRDGTLKELGATGIPLAITEFGAYSGGEEEFRPGDTLVIYSDGIPEARVGKDFYSDERLQAKTLELAKSGVPATEFVEKLLVDVRIVAGEGMRADDVTLVVVRSI